MNYPGPEQYYTMFWDPTKVVNKKDCLTLEEAGVESIVKQYEEDSTLLSEIIQRHGYAWMLRELANLWRKTRKVTNLSCEDVQICDLAKAMALVKTENSK